MFPGHFLIHHLSAVCIQITTTDVATAYPSGTPEFTPIFLEVLVIRSQCYVFMFCRQLFVLLFLLFWPFCCLFFFDIPIMITLWYLQTLIKVQRSKFDRNDVLYFETLLLYCLSFFHSIVCHPSIVLSVILPLYFLSSFHMLLSNTLLVCSLISQKNAQL